MSSNPNPYSAPQAELFDEAPAKLPAGASGMWRDGNYLVVHRQAKVPLDRCVATNLVSPQLMAWEIRSDEDWLMADLPVVPDYLWNLRKGVALAMAPFILSFVAAGAWRAWFPSDLIFGWIVLIVGLALSLVGYWHGPIALGLYRKSDPYCWIEGAHREYLARLPNWPYEPIA